MFMFLESIISDNWELVLSIIRLFSPFLRIPRATGLLPGWLDFSACVEDFVVRWTQHRPESQKVWFWVMILSRPVNSTVEKDFALLPREASTSLLALWFIVLFHVTTNVSHCPSFSLAEVQYHCIWVSEATELAVFSWAPSLQQGISWEDHCPILGLY